VEAAKVTVTVVPEATVPEAIPRKTVCRRFPAVTVLTCTHVQPPLTPVGAAGAPAVSPWEKQSRTREPAVEVAVVFAAAVAPGLVNFPAVVVRTVLRAMAISGLLRGGEVLDYDAGPEVLGE